MPADLRRKRASLGANKRPRHIFDTGVVLFTYLPGHPRNGSGFMVECDVVLVQTRQVHRNVPVLQRSSGVYSQHPRYEPIPSFTDEALKEADIDLFYRGLETRLTRLDSLSGEQVVLGYLRSNDTDPFIAGSFEHSQTKLASHRRFGRRYRLVHQGAVALIDDKGAALVDLRQSKAKQAASMMVQLGEQQPLIVDTAAGSLSISGQGSDVLLRHSSGARCAFSLSGPLLLRTAGAQGVITLEARKDARLELTPGSSAQAKLSADKVVLEEDDSDSHPGRVTVSATGVRIEKGEEELLQLLRELLQALSSARPVVGGSTGTMQLDTLPPETLSTVVSRLEDRLAAIGDF